MSHKLVSLYIGEGEYYTRTDVDKVIAEKNKEIEQLQAMLEERNKQVCELIEKNKRLANKDMIMASETIKDVLKELRHQKYKRCLDRVKWCDERIARYSLQQEIQRIGWQKEIKFYRKLRDKYLELAEKFKEVK